MSAMQTDGMSMAARFVDGARVRLYAIAWTLSCTLFLFPANASSGDMNAWEEQRRAQAGQDMEAFKHVIENRRDRLIASRPALQRKQLEGIEVSVGTDAYYTFVCETSVFVDDNGNRRRQLLMTVETIVTIYKVAGAIALRILDPSLGDEWSRDYLLYMRKTPNGVPIIDPLRARGLITADGAIRQGISREMFTKWEEESKALADSMLMFLVAHEIGHFANWLTDRQTTESEVDFERRRRASEAEADKFGLTMLLDIERSSAGFSPIDRPQFFPKGAPILFFVVGFVHGRFSPSHCCRNAPARPCTSTCNI